MSYTITGPLGDKRYWWRIQVRDEYGFMSYRTGTNRHPDGYPQTEEQATRIARDLERKGYEVITLVRPDVDEKLPPDKPHRKEPLLKERAAYCGLTPRQRYGLGKTRS